MRKKIIAAAKTDAQENEKERTTSIQNARNTTVEKPELVRDRAVAAQMKMT